MVDMFAQHAEILRTGKLEKVFNKFHLLKCSEIAEMFWNFFNIIMNHKELTSNIFIENRCPPRHTHTHTTQASNYFFFLLWHWKFGQGIYQRKLYFNHWFTSYCAGKKVSCQGQCQIMTTLMGSIPKHYVSPPCKWGDINISKEK